MGPRRVLPVLVVVLGALWAAAAPAGAWSAHGSTKQAYVLDARKGQSLRLVDAAGRTVARGRADRLGSRIFRAVPPAAGYRVVSRGRRSQPFRVAKRGQDPTTGYASERQPMRAGLNYVRMRDGVELAMTVRLPAGKTLADGPFPTVVEYSGYQTAAPNAIDLAGTGEDPLAPASSTLIGGFLSPLLGFASVSVQMRGSGCSGGAFDLFDLPTTYDGYDAIEAVAKQPWVKNNKVGMVGISFSGITQLFTAGTRPPHLAAIAPLSVTDDQYTGTGFPGGIRNSGFATSWIKERMADARPAPAGGQPWARALTKAGDEHCIANQRLRLQTQDAVRIQSRTPFRDADVFGDRSPARWMRSITVPTFLAGQFHDEQTGGHFTEALPNLGPNPKVWITLQNGPHVDSVSPDVITRWYEFLSLYVADAVPQLPPTVVGGLGDSYTQVLAGAPGNPVRQSRFAGMTDVAAARAVFEQDPRVRLVMDNGAGPKGPGSLGGTWEIGTQSWPPREAVPTRWWLGAGGGLTTAPPATTAPASYVADPAARPAQTLPNGDDAWVAQPPYDWRPLADGKGLGFTTAPLDADVVIAGPSSLDLRLRSSAPDTDLQVTLSEVRPDGQETYVQSGFLRASHRKLRPSSTPTDAVPTHLRKDAAPLPKGGFAAVRVPIFGVAHAFRAGSRLRVSVSAVGGDRPIWDFATVDAGKTTNTIALGGADGSSLSLPVLPGATAQGTPLPAASALRGEPTRGYVPAANGG